MNSQQLQELIEAHGPALALYARQFCHAAEDAVQEALIDLVRQQPPPDNVVAWLYVTTRRRALNQARSEQRRARQHRQAGQNRPAWFLPTDAGQDDSVDLESLLRRLDSLDREIVVARIWGQQSFAQISALVGLPLSSVHRRYQQALRALGNWLQTSTREVRSPDASRTTLS